MGKIPEAFLVQLREIPIDEVAEKYFNLISVNNIFQTSCIHGDDTDPSLTFFPQTNTFYCFGCGAGKRPQTEGSDVISFVMWIEKCTFNEAVAKLAELKGLQIPKEAMSEEEKKRAVKLEKLLDVNRTYWENLQSNPEVLAYLEERGIGPEEVNKWRIGLVPKGSQHENRISFALMNSFGQTVGFSYRNTTGIITGVKDEKAKYINSPNSDIFNKSSILYGLNFVKKRIRELDVAIIGEGFGDSITAQKLNLPFVSLMGTSLTDAHIEIIKEHTNNVILWMDGDFGGDSAAYRHSRLLRKKGFNVKVISFPNQDPDDVLLDIIRQNEGQEVQENEAWDVINQNTMYASQFMIKGQLDAMDKDIMEIRMKTLSVLDLILKDVEDGAEKLLLIESVANRFNMKFDDIRKILNI